MGARPAPLLIFGAVFAAAFVLAALGYFSLRRWEAAAELQLHGQARDTAAMAAEKVEMAVVRESISGNSPKRSDSGSWAKDNNQRLG